jgi:hypothetical protein
MFSKLLLARHRDNRFSNLVEVWVYFLCPMELCAILEVVDRVRLVGEAINSHTDRESDNLRLLDRELLFEGVIIFVMCPFYSVFID